MKRMRIPIPWREGLHLRPAAELVKLAARFQSSIRIRLDEHLADARSIIALMLLSATCGAVVDFEVSGDDEEAAAEAIVLLFEPEVEGDAEGEGVDPDKGDPPPVV